MTDAKPKKTHAQLHKELRDAFNERHQAENAHRRDEVAEWDAKISEIRSLLPKPKGTKLRWK